MFRIADQAQRKAAIKKCVEWEHAHVVVLRTFVAQHQQELHEERAKRSKGGWGSAAIWAALSVAFGYWIFREILGAIGGAVVGFFLGQREIVQFQAQSDAEIRRAEAECADSVKSFGQQITAALLFVV